MQTRVAGPAAWRALPVRAAELLPRTARDDRAAELLPRTARDDRATELLPRTARDDRATELLPRTARDDRAAELLPRAPCVGEPSMIAHTAIASPAASICRSMSPVSTAGGDHSSSANSASTSIAGASGTGGRRVPVETCRHEP
jgi:hypothetical protein